MEEERRRAKRYPVCTEARITMQGNASKIVVSVQDISTVGMKCRVDRSFNAGDRIEIDLKVMLSAKETMDETITGQIVWTVKTEDDTDYFLGIEFHGLEKQSPKLYDSIHGLGDFLFPA